MGHVWTTSHRLDTPNKQLINNGIPSLINLHTKYIYLSTKKVLQAHKFTCMQNITREIQRRYFSIFRHNMSWKDHGLDFLLSSATGKVHLGMKQNKSVNIYQYNQDRRHQPLPNGRVRM